MFKINAAERPKFGNCTINPLSTKFEIECFGWKDVNRHLPLEYAFLTMTTKTEGIVLNNFKGSNRITRRFGSGRQIIWAIIRDSGVMSACYDIEVSF